MVTIHVFDLTKLISKTPAKVTFAGFDELCESVPEVLAKGSKPRLVCIEDNESNRAIYLNSYGLQLTKSSYETLLHCLQLRPRETLEEILN